MQPSRYLRVEDLHRLRHHFLVSRRAVGGYYAGRHPSPRRGHSVEFSDYRPYLAGDCLSDIDWKVFGRSDKLFVRLFEHQSDMTVNLLVDGSASMAYRGMDAVSGRPHGGGSVARPHSKFDQAALLAVTIAFLTLKQQDRVSFALAAGGLRQFQPAQSKFAQLDDMLRSLEGHQPQGAAGLAEALGDLAGRVDRRGVLMVLSDLLDHQPAILEVLARFYHRGSEVILFHILHPDELQLPDVADAVFQDSETEERLRLNVEEVRPAYQEKLRRRLDSWRTACAGRGIDYHLVSTATDYSRVLEKYLFTRAARV